jgi:hypothetical protein
MQTQPSCSCPPHAEGPLPIIRDSKHHPSRRHPSRHGEGLSSTRQRHRFHHVSSRPIFHHHKSDTDGPCDGINTARQGLAVARQARPVRVPALPEPHHPTRQCRRPAGLTSMQSQTIHALISMQSLTIHGLISTSAVSRAHAAGHPMPSSEPSCLAPSRTIRPPDAVQCPRPPLDALLVLQPETRGSSESSLPFSATEGRGRQPPVIPRAHEESPPGCPRQALPRCRSRSHVAERKKSSSQKSSGNRPG